MIIIFIAIVGVETFFYLAVTFLKRYSPWLITKQDELPSFDPRALHKFIANSYDPKLGWVRRPNTSGTEQGSNGLIIFSIDSTGSREYSFQKADPAVAAFGDSYVFCRQVENDETWEAQLAKMGDIGVMNYGVGNYGLDQALLRYEASNLPKSVGVVILGFVPETICRIQSYWKHYLEFGNTFAFKPRFLINQGGDLELIENIMSAPNCFRNLPDYLVKIKKYDKFYLQKFKSYQFRFPYTLCFLKHPIRHAKLIFFVALKQLFQATSILNSRIDSFPFSAIMEDNVRDANKLYLEQESRELLTLLLSRFKKIAESRGHIPLVLVMPQLFDLKAIKQSSVANYQEYFKTLDIGLSIIDIADSMMEECIEKFYINDKYGGHFSPLGNKVVADRVFKWLEDKLK